MLRTTVFLLTPNPVGMVYSSCNERFGLHMCLSIESAWQLLRSELRLPSAWKHKQRDSIRVKSLATARNPPPTFLPQLDHARYSLPPSLFRATSCLPPPAYGPP